MHVTVRLRNSRLPSASAHEMLSTSCTFSTFFMVPFMLSSSTFGFGFGIRKFHYIYYGIYKLFHNI